MAYAAVTRMRLPPAKEWPTIALAGLCGVTIYHTALNYGELTVPAGTASLIIATVPVFTSVLSRFTLGERLSAVAWGGFALSLLGIVIMTLGGEREVGFTLGAIYVVISALSGAVYFVLMKRVVGRYDPVDATAAATWAGTLPLLVFSPGIVEAVREAPLHATLAGVYIGVFPAGIAYAAWGIAMSRLPVSRVSAFLYLVPPLAILWGWVWAAEVPAPITFVGGLVALLGVIVVQRWGRPRPAPSPASG